MSKLGCRKAKEGWERGHFFSVASTCCTICEMAAFVNESPEFEEWNAEELEEILSMVDKLEKEMEEESDVDVSEGSDDEGEEENATDPEDNVPLAHLQKWRSATQPVTVRPFERSVGPQHDLPSTASALDFLFLFLPQFVFDLAAAETNRYARQKAEAKNGAPDPLWHDTTPDEIRAYIAILIMMGIKQLPRIWCYWSCDRRFGDPWISSIMTKTRFFKLNQ